MKIHKNGVFFAIFSKNIQILIKNKKFLPKIYQKIFPKVFPHAIYTQISLLNF